MLLPKIIELGAKPRAPTRCLALVLLDARRTGKELEMVVLDAILSDCEKTSDAIMLAVKWRQPP